MPNQAVGAIPNLAHLEQRMKPKNPNLTAERLREVLSYDPDTGVFVWKISTSQLRAGAIASRKTNKGYIRIKIDRQTYAGHRLAWFYVHGRWPVGQPDHRNGIRDDNRIANLREATNADNCQNCAMSSINTSGCVGVSWDSREKVWVSRVTVKGKTLHRRRFASFDDAVADRRAAKARIHAFQPFDRKASI